MKSTIFALSLGLVLGLIPVTATAAHSDIWITLDNNQIVVSSVDLESGEPINVDQTTGRLLFLGDFSDLGQGPQGTDDPGYQAQSGVLQANAILNYRAVGIMQFWTGNTWSNTVGNQEQISYFDALGGETIWTVSGVSQAEGVIDQIASDGSVHAHLDFEVTNAGSLPVVGAYMVDLELYVTDGVGGPIVHTTSEPVRIAFNFQLSESDFNAAINALVNPLSIADEEEIPVLPLWAMFSLGASLMLIRFKTDKRKKSV